MSIALFFLVPAGLLAIAWSFCFVGCVLNTHGTAPPLTYSDVVLGEDSLLAYWPLNDAQNAGTPLTGSLLNSSSFGTAKDHSTNNHDGTYVVPPLYPDPPIATSAPIPGGQAALDPTSLSIVPGDSGTTAILNPSSTDFAGGYVSIPWSTQSPPKLDQFTFEAWIQPGWTAKGAAHVLFGALASDSTGFVIAIEETGNFLQVVVGDGMMATPHNSGVTIDLTTATYIAVTGDSGSGTFTFFAEADGGMPMNDSVSGTGYKATDPTQQPVTFFIAAGRNAQAPRTNDGDVNGAPEFPFVGLMQSAALYGSVLTDIDMHFSVGSAG